MQNKTFRLFVSSTFSDFNEERKLLQTIVFPEIKKYCRDNGLNFQPIDLRWGVSAEAQLDQKTLELCINEVQSSKINPHPNFLIMSGDRYGWIPLHYAVPECEYNEILSHINNSDDIELLNSWYKLDSNQIPASYIINERKDEYIEYSPWEILETKLRIIIQTAVNKSNLNDENKKKYFASATEQEVLEGIFKYLNPTPFQNKLIRKDSSYDIKDENNVYAYIRNIKSFDDENLKDKFVDNNLNKVNEFKTNIKNNSINPKNILEVNVNLKDISQDSKNGSLNYSYNEIENQENSIFVQTMISYLKNSINEYVNTIKDITPDELEKYEQIRFKEDKLKDFIEGSRTEALNKIDEYISNDNNQALVIYGKSGLGKSSLIAKAIENNKTKKPIYRFVGSTSNLSNTPNILISILNELNIKEEIRKVLNPQTAQEENEKLEIFYYRVHDHFKALNENIIIFLDAIDQINNEDIFLWLPESLPINLKIIITALEDETYPLDSIYFENLKTKTNNIYALNAFTQTKELITSILKRYDRTITPTQLNYLEDIYKDIQTPLYLNVAAQEIRHWKSNDNTQTLEITQKEIIKEFIENLSKLYHHDKEFVKRVFSYLYLSNGLSESEILEIISIDEKFVSEIAPDTFHKNESNELPIVIWARLHSQIKEFLKLENKDNQETMNFFHREFGVVIKNSTDLKNTHEELIALLQKLIIKYQDEEFDKTRWGKLYIEVVKDYHLKYEFKYVLDDDLKLKEYSVFLSNNIDDKDYLETLLMLLLSTGFNLEKINRTKESNYYLKFYYYSTKELYLKNKRWAEFYTRSLNNLAVSLKAIGETQEAIALEKESLEILKELYSKNKERWAESYTRSLDNLAVSLKAIGETQEAIALEKESLEILKELYSKNKEKWAESYTISLNNLASLLNTIGKTQESIALGKESLEILKELYSKNKERWAESYTSSLNNLAVSLKYIGKTQEAIALEKESLEILKELYSKNKEKWAESYTRSLNNLAASLKAIGKTQEAIALEKESLEILKELYSKNKERWAESYTSSLNNLAGSLKDIEKTQEAINLQKESLEILKELYSENKERWAESYTRSLNNLAALLNTIGKTQESIALGKESLEILKELYLKNKERWAELYTRILNNLVALLNKIGKTQESIALGKESLEILKELYSKNKERWAESYTRSLNNLASLLNTIGKTQEAIALGKESLEILKELYSKNKERWANLYTRSLDNLAALLKTIGKTQEAINLEKESLEILKELYLKNKERWAELYTRSLNNLAALLNIIGKTQEAINLEKESLEIRKELYLKNKERWAELYILSLNNLAVSYYNNNQIDKSLELFSINYVIHKEHYGENDKRTLNILANIKIVNGNTFDKIEATITDLLYLSKFIAQVNTEKEISINSFVNAFGFIEFNEEAKGIFSQIINLDKIKNFEDAKQYIEKVKNTPKILYSDDMTSLVGKLKEIFGNNPIGKLR